MVAIVELGTNPSTLTVTGKSQPTAALHWATTTRLRSVLVMTYRFIMMVLIAILKMQDWNLNFSFCVYKPVKRDSSDYWCG